jgi:hypothetical protein
LLCRQPPIWSTSPPLEHPFLGCSCISRTSADRLAGTVSHRWSIRSDTPIRIVGPKWLDLYTDVVGVGNEQESPWTAPHLIWGEVSSKVILEGACCITRSTLAPHQIGSHKHRNCEDCPNDRADDVGADAGLWSCDSELICGGLLTN